MSSRTGSGRLAALVLLGPLACAPAQDFTSRHAQAVERMVPGLEKLAAWCHKKGLHGDRDRLYAVLLQHRPDHRRARSTLRYRKVRGRWVQSSRYRPPKNRTQKYDGEFVLMRDDLLGPFRDTMLKLVEQEGDRLPFRLREQALLEVVALHPDCEAARHALGERFESGEWLLRETLRARKRRAFIRKVAEDALAAVGKPTILKPPPEDVALGVPFVGTVKTARLRIATTTDERELRRLHRLLSAIWNVLDQAAFTRPVEVDDLRIYTLKNRTEARALFAKHPQATAREKNLIAQAVGMWIDARHLVEYPDHADRRVDGVLRQVIGYALKGNHGIGGDQAWIWEGLGNHLAWLLTDTRLTTFLRPGSYDRADPEWEALQRPDSDWLLHARKLLQKKRHPDLRTVLHKKVNDLTTPDLLLSYALSVFLLEGRPDDLKVLLPAVGRGALDPEEAVGRFLRTDPPGLERRLLRWLLEMERT